MKGQNKVKISFIYKKGSIFFGDEIKEIIGHSYYDTMNRID